MAARLIRPISSVEFAQMVKAVRPPSGWSETLGVANSGGPDSTCLVFLLHRYLKDSSSLGMLPRRLVSLTVDHDLQDGSSAMANHAGRIASSLGVEHVTIKLAWGEGIHPSKPGPHEKIEGCARDMRYAALLENMTSLGANALALGHHCDDQVETMLMRLGRGSGQFGLAGMRPYRRWGMGIRKNEDSRSGIEGMKKWIVRPLLTVGKDRILATCEEHGLDYINDPTNFQPQLTIRNAIRHVIKKGGTKGLVVEDPVLAEFPTAIAQQLADINVAASEDSGLNFSLATDLDRIRTISQNMTSALSDVDRQVDQFIAKHRLPSPPGTFMISPLSLAEIESPIMQEALLYRITRFVSPEPWGSPRAELGRRKGSITRLIKHLWNYQLYRSRSNNSLCVGSGVWWRLVSIRKNQMRTTVKTSTVDELAWIAARQPGHRMEDEQDGPHPLKLNVTKDIHESRKAWLAEGKSKAFEILFDCRFLIRFDMDKMPTDIAESLSAGGKIRIKPLGIWILPQVIHVTDKEELLIHTNIVRQPFVLEKEWGTKVVKNLKSTWIEIEYLRPSSAI